MELGIYSFGELITDPAGRSATTMHEKFEQALQLGRTADQGGLDVLAFGEHHRADFSTSAPEMTLAAIASTTAHLRVASGVTVLSSQDPVRVFQQYATLDHLSNGRAEIIAGRGAFIESFPLFGFDLNDYDALFDEKLDLLLQLREQDTISWAGQFRPPLDHAEISPRPLQDVLPVWVAIGGTPASAVRAGYLGLPMMMGFFTGPEHFVPRVELYRRAAAAAGHNPDTLRLGASGHMFIGKTSQAAQEEFYPYYSRYFQHGGRAPFAANGFPRDAYAAWIRDGLPVGSPQQVIDAIMRRVELLGIDRFLGQIDVGNLPWPMIQSSLELYMTEVAPVIRQETATLSGAA
jgi:alkanesulfonate monooxygenase SsuD/methylene tetrahydromethanopterin reductase-like flavin-dependent oxidoreductase (luciferase family)